MSDQWRSAGSGVQDRDPPTIGLWNPRKNCRSFVDAASSELRSFTIIKANDGIFI